MGDEDLNHLQRATQMGRVLCTYDSDFVRLADEGVKHGGIVFGQQDRHSIGVRVKFLQLVYGVYSPEEMRDRVKYVG